MMTIAKFATAMLRAAVTVGIAAAGITAATAQTDNSMGGMQMAPGSKMDMKGKKMPAMKMAHHKKAMHHHQAAVKKN
jgi:hypothetical protein